MHPGHVPFIMESETAGIWRRSNVRPRRALFCYREYARRSRSYHIVELFKELHRVQVALIAEHVVFPVAVVFFTEVHIEHARNAVYSDPVDVVLLSPVHRVGKKEASYLRAAEIELVCAPLRMLSALVEHAAVELAKAVLIHTEMTRHPVQYHSNSRLVAAVNKVSEIPRASISGSRSIVAGHLVAP